MKNKSPKFYYLDYSHVPYPKSARKLIIGYEKEQFLERIKEESIPIDWYCWLSQCGTEWYIIEGDINKVIEWISKNVPEKYEDIEHG